MPRGYFRSFREEFDLVSLRSTLNALKWLGKKTSLHRTSMAPTYSFNSKGRLIHFLSPYKLNHENHSTAEDWGFIWAITLWFLVKLELRFLTLNRILKWFSKIVEMFFEICLPFKSKIANCPEATQFLELTDSTVCAGILLTRPLTAHNYQAVYQYMVVYDRRFIRQIITP